MTHKKTAHIEISGHTDNVGKKSANKKLSQQRADAVRAYLVAKGIDPDRIKAVGYGDEKPVASNDTSEGRQKNRRIEVIAL
jgi:outer membrane protein OmpA-like peptidoglycan-associated protein